MKTILGIVVIVINFYGWYAIYNTGMAFFTGTQLGAAKSSSSAQIIHEEIITAQVTSDTLNMRKGPAADNAIIKTLNKGDTLVIVERSEGTRWVRVEFEGTDGYVHSDYIIIEGE